MVKVAIGNGRSTINDLPQGIEIIIPAINNIFIVLFLSVWLVAWAFGEVSAISKLTNSESTQPFQFMTVWLAVWTVGGGFAIVSMLWHIKGKEVIRIDGIKLKYIRNFVLYSRSKEYEVAHIKGLRTTPHDTSIFTFNNGIEYWGLSGGAIAFDYGMTTHQLGISLDEAEAKHIVYTVKKRYKSL